MKSVWWVSQPVSNLRIRAIARGAMRTCSKKRGKWNFQRIIGVKTATFLYIMAKNGVSPKILPLFVWGGLRKRILAQVRRCQLEKTLFQNYWLMETLYHRLMKQNIRGQGGLKKREKLAEQRSGGGKRNCRRCYYAHDITRRFNSTIHIPRRSGLYLVEVADLARRKAQWVEH